MAVYVAVSIVCLLLMSAGLIAVIARLAVRDRAERITYIRNFKRGKGALIYLVALPLYWAGLIYNGDKVFESFFNAVRRVVDLIVLKYDVSPINALVEACPIYSATVYVCFVLVRLNAILFAASILSQYVWNGYTNLKFSLSSAPRLIIFGNNQESRAIYTSEVHRTAIIVDKIIDKSALELYLKDIVYHSINKQEKYVAKVVDRAIKRKQETIVVINMGDDEKNLSLSRIFANTISALDKDSKDKCFEKLRIFTYGDAKYQAIYVDVLKRSNGCITYLNKYQKIAIDFIDKYPFAKFLTEEQVDYSTSLIREGVDVNAFLIGFGKTNQQIFLSSVANNQFIEKVNDEVVIKKVKYHIFDRYPAENDKNLNHNYYRYKHECIESPQGTYLALPDYPAEESIYHFDVNDVNFYSIIRSVALANASSANFIIVAFGSDLENIDMAQKLSSKCDEWGIKNINIFVKVRNATPARLLEGVAHCYVIATEADCVYDIEKIVGDQFFRMARKRDEIYSVEHDLKQSKISIITPEYLAKTQRDAKLNWYMTKTQIERDSSIYASLSLRAKLNLMGLDYCQEEDDRVGLTAQEYLDVYAKDDQPDTGYYQVSFDGKPIVHYTLDYMDSRRRNMAIHEHLRWNSYMISQGVIPATIDQILHETTIVKGKEKHTNGKNYALRRHGNITTFAGLERFRELVSERDKTTPLENDVIMYDYQLLDDAYYILKASGYKIIKR